MKKELGRRTSALLELADSLDILDSADFRDQVGTKNERKNSELCWRSRLPVKPSGFGAESFELVVLPCGDAPRLLRFMGQLDGMLHDDDSYGDILRTAHTWEGGAVITIQMQPTKFSNLVLKMALIPEVDKVAEGPPATGAVSSFLQRFGSLLMSAISAGRKICITLM